MGDVGRGLLEVYNPETEQWLPACVANWDSKNSAQAICGLMGYTQVNYTSLSIKDVEVSAPHTVNWTDYKKKVNWVRDFRSCGVSHYPTVKLECQSYGNTQFIAFFLKLLFFEKILKLPILK